MRQVRFRRRGLDRLNPPDLRVELVSNYGDHIVVQLIQGNRLDPDGLLFVERRGMHEVVREEVWGERRLLTLRAFPARRPSCPQDDR